MNIKALQSKGGNRRADRPPGPRVEREKSSIATPALGAALVKNETARIVVADLCEQDYLQARLIIADVAALKDYEDWLDLRAGTIAGLQMAGFFVEAVRIDLRLFQRWLGETSSAPSLSALDRFASVAGERGSPDGAISRKRN